MTVVKRSQSNGFRILFVAGLISPLCAAQTTSVSFNSPSVFIAQNGACSAVAGDFNNDGHLDLAVPSGANTIAIMLGQGNGTFAPPVNYTVGENACYAAVGDFNRDGNLDVAVANGARTASQFCWAAATEPSVPRGNTRRASPPPTSLPSILTAMEKWTWP